MANWNLPTLSSLVADVLSILKERDVDTARMFREQPTNPIDGMIRYNRSQNRFEEYNESTSSWVPLLVAISGGGTGASTAADARSNLGVKSMGTQESNNVSISGGTISGLSSLSVSGSVSAGTFSGSGSGLTNIPNSATSATNLNSPNTIVLRDSSGNFSAGTITASLNGNANTVTNGVYTTGSYDNPSWLTGLSANKLNSGTVADARLSSNIPRYDGTAHVWSGISRFSNQPRRKRYRSSSMSLSNDTWTIVGGFDSAVFEISGPPAVNDNPSPGYFTGSEKLGCYLVHFQCTFLNNGQGGIRKIAIGIGGIGDSYFISRDEAPGDPSKPIVLNAIALVDYSTDFSNGVWLAAYQDSGQNVSIYGSGPSNTYYEIVKVC